MTELIQSLIPQYGELNRIYSDLAGKYAFSFEKQKFITDFYQKFNDTKAFENAIIELVLGKQEVQYTLVFKSLKTEIEKNLQMYAMRPELLKDDHLIHVCYKYADRYNSAIDEQLKVTRELQKPLNEAYNRYDSIGYIEHTPEEEKRAEKEYERCKAEYDREKEKLDNLYDLQSLARKEIQQYMENRCDDIYRLSSDFLEILRKYIPDAQNTQDEPNEPDISDKQETQQETVSEQHEYFDMKLLSPLYETCVGEQFEEISTKDFYANMNLQPCGCLLKIKPREKIRVCYLIFLMSERLPKQDKDEWKNYILKLLGIEESYYKSKYKEPVSDLPSDSNVKFAKEMRFIFK